MQTLSQFSYDYQLHRQRGKPDNHWRLDLVLFEGRRHELLFHKEEPF
ncbi:hypothetical protein EV12_1134 [Prochlorococcus sp. MIT 0701]|nr:hypothetical protein EV12_1134 [Prochlorococcus sp. MIT 0701]